jgi:Major capsid protein Gp23
MIREFKFFHGITIQTEGIGGLIRTLRARWEVEDIENLNTIHGIDAEAELTRILNEEIGREMANEIDREIMRTLTRNWNGEQRA